MNPLLQRISVDPNVCFGRPCVRGTRIWVSLILDVFADGMGIQEVLAEYPSLGRKMFEQRSHTELRCPGNGMLKFRIRLRIDGSA